MTHLSTRTIILALLIVLGIAALPSTAGAAPSFVDKQVQANILLLQGYIDSYAITNRFAYPPVAMVRKGGGLTAPIWPANPWSGKTMVPGKARGTYTYRLTATGYALIGHLSKGSYKVTGGLPAWLSDERDMDSKMALALIEQYVDAWASTNGGLPPAEQVTQTGAVGAQPGVPIWPVDPWTGGPMSPGPAPGQFTYATANGTYTLSVHLSGGGSWSPPGR